MERTCGGRVQEHDQTRGEGVACDASEEDGKPLYGCQSVTCDRKVQTRRYVDLVPVVFPEDWFGCTRDVCAECWTVLNGGDRPIRTLKKEQSHRRKSGLDIQPFGIAGLTEHCVGSTSKPQEN